MTDATRIRGELLIGPLTAPECAAIIEMKVNRCASYMICLEKQGHVSIFGTRAGDDGVVDSHIYELTPRGLAVAKGEARAAANMHTGSVPRRRKTPQPHGGTMNSGNKNNHKSLISASAVRNPSAAACIVAAIIPAAPASMGNTDRGAL